MYIQLVLLAGALTLTACRSADPHVVRERTRVVFGDDSRAAPESPVPTTRQILETADLDLYLRYGMHNNASLRAAYERWRAALERVPQADSLPDPSVSFMHFVEAVQTRTGPQERRYGISQSFPWFGKLRLRGDVAAAAAEELWHRVESTRLAVRRDIEVAFYEYGYVAQSTRITSQILALLQQLEPVAQNRIRAGARQDDLLRLQVEIGRIENDLASLTKLRPALSARLASSMNWTDGGLLPLPELVEPVTEPVATPDLMTKLDTQNPRIRELLTALDRGRDAVALSRLERWPDFTVGVDYLETGVAIAPGTRGSGDDPVGLRVAFNVPIWGPRYDAAERQAARELDAATATLQQERFDLRADVELGAFRLGDAARQAALYQDSLLPRSRELLTVTRTAYRAGTASLLDLLDSERSLLNFEIAYWRAARDYLQAEARLRVLVGGPIR